MGNNIRYFNGNNNREINGYELLNSKMYSDRNRIVTCSKALDTLLNGGVKLGEITELVGLSGVGKTQICMQLACDVQIPVFNGGLNGKSIYINTKCDLNIKRLKRIAKSLADHIVHSSAKKNNKERVKHINWEYFLKNIYIFNCFNINDFIDVIINKISKLLLNDNKIKLIIIDSISYLIKNNNDVYQYILKILNKLNEYCVKYNIGIILTNSLTTKLLINKRNKKYIIIPSLGNIYSYMIHTRIKLELIDNKYHGQLLYNNNTNIQPETKKERYIEFNIKNDGIRDIK